MPINKNQDYENLLGSIVEKVLGKRSPESTWYQTKNSKVQVNISYGIVYKRISVIN